MRKLNEEKTMTKRKITRRIVVAVAAAVFSLSLVGCGTTENATSEVTKSTEAVAESSKDVDPLSFVKTGEIYFDNQLGSSVTVSVDGQKLDGKTTAFKKGMKVSVDGLDPEGSTSYVIVFVNKSTESDRSSVAFSSGIDNSRLSESLSAKINADVEKVCVCLFKPGETWNKDLSEAMNAQIRKFVPAGMIEN